MNKIYEWLWRFLPDCCQMCRGKRGGMRGNENVHTIGTMRIVMCDYCSSEFSRWQKHNTRREELGKAE